MTVEQLATVLQKPNRRERKQYLHLIGGTGSAAELAKVLQAAEASPEAVAEAERMNDRRQSAARAIEAGIDSGAAEVIVDIRVTLREAEMTQDQLAALCGWPSSQLSAYLNGSKSPDLTNLVKMADALGHKWRLIPKQP